MGSLARWSEEQHARSAKIQVRAGSHKLDNRNFFSLSMGGSGVSRGTGGFASLPLDDNYDEIRRQLWLATDGTYRKALEDLSKKRAVLENKNRSEEIPDFSQESGRTLSDVLPAVAIDPKRMEDTVRRLSALFKEAPGVYSSQVYYRVSNELVRYVNSEGTSYSARQPEITVTVTATSQALDGQPLSNLIRSAICSTGGRSLSVRAR